MSEKPEFCKGRREGCYLHTVLELVRRKADARKHPFSELTMTGAMVLKVKGDSTFYLLKVDLHLA